MWDCILTFAEEGWLEEQSYQLLPLSRLRR